MVFPKIEFVAAQPVKSDAIAFGWFQEESSEKTKGQSLSVQYFGKRTKEVDALTLRIKESKHFFGKKNETSLLRYFGCAGAPNTILLGLGLPKKWSAETARQAGAALSALQRRERLPKVSVQSDSIFAKVSEANQSRFFQAFCEGYLLAGYEYKELKKPETDPFVPGGLEFVGMKTASTGKAAEKARILASAVNFARSLGDRPGNILTPTEFARLSQEMAKAHGLKCSVLGREQIAKEKMGLFLGVAQGSAEEPKFIILEHRGGKKGDKPIVLVGKGITFDSGGISLKPAARMEDMKYDMMGAAAVAGIFQALGDLKIAQNVIGIIATTENMPGGKAQKPGDVMRSMTGKTVEIINTDAEGRLILADALEYAQKHFDPQAIVDFATLTGAVVDALGTVTSGIMGTHSGLIQQIKDAAQETAERVWELPLFEEYEEDLRSHVADIKNSGIREAGSSKGGTFLKFFVQSKYPWVHCDIAGTSYHRKDVNYHPQKYGAGVMVRLITHLLENWKTLK